MANNIDVTPGTGKTVATTDVGGFQYQNVILVDSSAVPIDFSAASPVTQSGTWNITNVSGTVSLPTGAATEASLAKLTLAQASSTTSQTGPLMQGAVTTAAPTYTTGQTNPFSLTTGGSLRVDAGSGSAATPSTASYTVQGLVADDAAAGTTNPVPVGGRYNSTLPTYTNGDRTQLQFTVDGNARVLMTAFNTSGADAVSNGLMAGICATGATSGGFTSQMLNTAGQVYNGTSWDRQRGIAGTFGAATGVTAVEKAGSTFAYISTATTTQVKSGAGILHKIIINTPVAGTISLIDNTAGSTVNIGVVTMTADVKPFALEYDLGFSTGLRIITSVAADITVVYR